MTLGGGGGEKDSKNVARHELVGRRMGPAIVNNEDNF